LKDVCGANDCQDPSIIATGITNIVSPSQEINVKSIEKNEFIMIHQRLLNRF